MRIAIAADHAGFPLKQLAIDTAHAAGHETTDLGTNSAARKARMTSSASAGPTTRPPRQSTLTSSCSTIWWAV